MRIYTGESFADVYKESLKDLLTNPDYESSPRGMACKEIIDATLVIDNPILGTYKNERRGSQYKYIAAEFLWYFLGRNDVAFIEKFASFWKQIQNEDGTVNSAYGSLLFLPSASNGASQYEWAINSIIKDKDTRQAVMHFNLPKHQRYTNKDFVCTMYGNFHVRDNKLHFSIKMRSNDAILGTATDIAFFTMLHQQAFLHLKKTYPELEMGKYTHIVDSYHIYERHFDLVKEMLEKDFEAESIGTLTTSLIKKDAKPSDALEELYNKYNNEDKQSNNDCEVYNFILENI